VTRRSLPGLSRTNQLQASRGSRCFVHRLREGRSSLASHVPSYRACAGLLHDCTGHRQLVRRTDRSDRILRCLDGSSFRASGGRESPPSSWHPGASSEEGALCESLGLLQHIYPRAGISPRAGRMEVPAPPQHRSVYWCFSAVRSFPRERVDVWRNSVFLHQPVSRS
jgi:hypothetical protein